MTRAIFIAVFLFMHTTTSAAPRTLNVAAYSLSPYVSAEGEEKGFVYEIVEKAFRDAGYTLTFHFYPVQRAKRMVETGEADVFLPNYAEDEASASPKLLYSNDIFTGEIVSLAPMGAPSRAADKGDVKAVLTDTEEILRKVDMLHQGRLEFMRVEKNVAAALFADKRPHLLQKLHFLPKAVAESTLRLAVSKDRADHDMLLSIFNKALAEMKKNGSYQKILERYGFQDMPREGQTLNIAAVANPDLKLLQKLSGHFLAHHPKVKINWAFMEENLLRRRIPMDAATREGSFDLVTVGTYDTPWYARLKWLDPYKDLSASYKVDDLLPQARENLSYEKQLYALPVYGETSMTYYRKDLFAKKKLTMPDQPSYDDIRRLAAAVHDPGNKEYGICLRGKAGWGENLATIATMAYSFGGQLFDKDWKPMLTSTQWVEAARFYIDLIKNFGPPDTFKNGYLENLHLFAEGHCAIWIDSTVAASYIYDKNTSQVSDKVAFARAPVKTKTNGSSWLWFWALAMPSGGKNKELAQAFAEWATSEEYLKLVAKEFGWLHVPPGTRQSTYSQEAYRKAAPFSAFVLERLQAWQPPVDALVPRRPLPLQMGSDEWPALGNVIGQSMSDVLKQQTNLDAALKNAQNKVRQIMYHAGYYSHDKPPEKPVD